MKKKNVISMKIILKFLVDVGQIIVTDAGRLHK